MKRILMIFAATAAIVSCRKGEELTQPQAPEVTITAKHLKTVIDDKGSVTWDGDEMISVLFAHTNGKEYHVETYENENEAGETAMFVGTIKSHVKTSSGWKDAAYCVCPSSSVKNTGKVEHVLPAEQYAHASVPGSFDTGLNLSYAKLSLENIEKKSQDAVMFQNALSVLRLVPGSGDITSITINGSAPLAGTAPMVFDKDNLVVETGSDWAESRNSVVLRPSGGNECFTEGVTYNILVYPGAHSSFSVTLNYKEYGDYTKSLKQAPTLMPAKYYTIGFTSDSEMIITEIQKDLTGIETNLPSLDQLEEDVASLLNQVQSVSLLTEYLDNAAYARYAQMTHSKQKLDVSLDYIVKPESAAEALVEAYALDSKVVSALLGYGKGAGLEIQSDPLAVKELILREIDGIGKVVTATVDASTFDNKFYDGTWSAAVALQIKSGRTDVISDFANLVPKAGSIITGSYLSNIPAVPGARVVVPFSYAVSGDDSPYTLTVTDSHGVDLDKVSVNNNDNFKTGNLIVNFDEGAIQTPSVTLNLTVGEGANKEEITQVFTFVDNGARINLTPSVQKVDYVGGEVTIDVQLQNLTGIGMLGHHSGDFLSYDSNSGIFTVYENTAANERTAQAKYTITVGSLEYEKYVTLAQYEKNHPLQKPYYADGEVKRLQSSSYSTPLNIVIVGDGYKKMNLMKDNGKFERNAQSAVKEFFKIEPFASFKDRFNVYMVAYSSEHEGPRLQVELEEGESAPVHNTKFGTSYKGASNTYIDCNKDIVQSVVRNDVGLDTDAEYYRTIVILLVNTELYLGSTDYTHQTTSNDSGDGYGSMGIAMVASSHMGTEDLIRHEAGGHAFGRLGDEYDVNWYTKDLVNQRHSVGFYWNVSTNTSTWAEFTNNGYTSDEVTYDLYCGGQLYRSTRMKGMMYETSGKFNAVCRKLIYERIIKQTQGASAYSFANFKAYDQKNR